MAEAPAISVRVKALKAGAAVGHRNHCTRESDDPDHVDSSRSHLNSTILEMPTVDKVAARCLEMRQAAFVPGDKKRFPRTMGKNTTPVVSGIITFSKTAQPIIEKLSIKEQDERFKKSAEYVAQELGTTLCGLIVHRDESAIHAHFSMYGFNEFGESISRKCQKAMLSKLQDEGARAFLKDGITRGKYIGQRLKDGDEKHKLINRSVHQLHNDLPRELAEAEERLAEMQRRVADTEAKLASRERELAAKDDKSAAGDRKLEKLEKRLATYENRLVDRQNEVNRLQKVVEETSGKLEELDKNIQAKQKKWADMAKTAVLPAPTKKAVVVKKTDAKGVFQSKTEEKTLVYYTQQQMREHDAKLSAELDATNKRLNRLNADVEKKITGYQHATDQEKHPKTLGFQALGGELVVRYGLVINETPKRISVPPQKPASAAQVAAALYRASRDKNWQKTHFNVSDEVAEKIIDMAITDGRSENVAFYNLKQRIRLFEETKKATREASEAAQAAKTGDDQGDEKTGLQADFERRQGPMDGPDFDDDHGGPSLG